MHTIVWTGRSVPSKPNVVGRKRRAKRSARIARRRLNPYTVKNSSRKNALIRNTIERDASCHDEIAHSGHFLRRAREPCHGFLGDFLDCEREVHVLLRKWHLLRARGYAKERCPFCIINRPQRRRKGKILHGEHERPVLFERNKPLENDAF